MQKKLIWVSIALATVAVVGIAGFYLSSRNGSSGGAELYLNLRSGMSEASVETAIGKPFISFDEVKQAIQSHELRDFNVELYISKVGDLVITPDLKDHFSVRHMVVPLKGDKAYLKTRYFRDQLYGMTVEFDLYTSEQILERGEEIKREVVSRYVSAKTEQSKEIPGAYSVSWKRPPVDAVLWVNPRDKILTVNYSDDSLFAPEVEKQTKASGSGF